MALLEEIPEPRAKKDLDITPEEYERIEKNLQNEEFRKLFFSYMEEISDPNNRALYEKELAQMEAEKGNSVRFVHPVAGFVAKTMTIPPGGVGVGGAEGEKVFLNLCSSPEIAEATMTASPKGQQWQVPYSLSQERKDKDKAGKECRVFDCVLHPVTLARAKGHAAFERLLVHTAMEGVERQFAPLRLQRTFKVLTSLKAKGDLATTVIRQANILPKRDGSSAEYIEKLAQAQAHAEQQGAAASSTPADAMKPDADTPAPRRSLVQEIQEAPMSAPSSAPTPKLPETPRYTITHQGLFADYQKYANARTHQHGARPDALCIRIHVPKVASAGTLDVDVADQVLVLTEAQGLYALHLQLPFPVDGEKGTAKFERGKRELVLTLPVLQPPPVDLPIPEDVPLERDEPEAVAEGNQGEEEEEEDPSQEYAGGGDLEKEEGAACEGQGSLVPVEASPAGLPAQEGCASPVPTLDAALVEEGAKDGPKQEVPEQDPFPSMVESRSAAPMTRTTTTTTTTTTRVPTFGNALLFQLDEAL